jgi:hypothetical protein
MTTTVNAAAIAAPSEELVDFLTAFLAANPPAGVADDIEAYDAVTGNEAAAAELVGVTDGDGWTIVGNSPVGATLGLAAMIVDLPAIAPPGVDVLQSPATLAVKFEADTNVTTIGRAIALVVDPYGEDGFQVLDTAAAAVVDGAAVVNLTGLGLAAVTGLASGDAILVFGLFSANASESTYEVDSFTLTIPTGAATMGSNNAHAQTANCMLIAVELDDSCEIVEGAAVFVTAGVGKLTPTVNTTEGIDYSAENFGGVVCGPDMKGDTQEKSIGLEGEFCLVNWGFMAMTSGNPKIVDEAGNVVGYQQLKRTASACDTNDKPRIALTVIRKASTGDGGCVTPSGVTGAQGSVAVTYPNTTDWVWKIPPHENIRAVVPFTAMAYTAPNPGHGPLNLYPASVTPERISSSALHAEYFVPFGSLPTIDDNGTLAHPAPLGKL